MKSKEGPLTHQVEVLRPMAVATSCMWGLVPASLTKTNRSFRSSSLLTIVAIGEELVVIVVCGRVQKVGGYERE